MPLIKRIGCIVASLVVVLIAGDVVGVVACFFGGFTSSRRWGSPGAIYAVWFVLGVFAGLFHYMMAGDLCAENSARDWTTRKGSSITSILVIGVSAAALLALSYALDRFMWRRGAESDDGYVPYSMSATMTYFATMFAAMLMVRWLTPTESASKKRNHNRGPKKPSPTTPTDEN